MSWPQLLNDRCRIQTRVVTPGMVDTEVFTPQATETRCRVIKQPSRRRTSPDSAEKIQYGTFIFTNIVLPKNAIIVIHDRVEHKGRVYDVLEVIEARDGKGPHHLVALCDARA